MERGPRLRMVRREWGRDAGVVGTGRRDGRTEAVRGRKDVVVVVGTWTAKAMWVERQC